MLVHFFTNEEQEKRLAGDIFETTATHTSYVHDFTNTDFWAAVMVMCLFFKKHIKTKPALTKQGQLKIYTFHVSKGRQQQNCS